MQNNSIENGCWCADYGSCFPQLRAGMWVKTLTEFGISAGNKLGTAAQRLKSAWNPHYYLLGADIDIRQLRQIDQFH